MTLPHQAPASVATRVCPANVVQGQRMHQLESVARLSDDLGITDEPPIPWKGSAMCP
jgi:hypothetical protein